MTAASPPAWTIKTVGVSTWSPPTKKLSGAAAFGLMRPSSIRPLMIRTAPT